MIDINKIVSLGKGQLSAALKEYPNVPKEEVFEKVYTALLDDFLEVLVSEFYKGFMDNVKTFSDMVGAGFSTEVPNAKTMAQEITEDYVLTKENFEINLSKIRFLQKDKNSFMDFISLMQKELTENKIGQFLAFYTADDGNQAIRTCSKITDWIEMVGLLEVMKSRVMNHYQNNMTEIK